MYALFSLIFYVDLIFAKKKLKSNIIPSKFQVFGLLRQGDGRIIITASFEDKMQTVRLPVLETEEAAWEFFEILFEELRCEPFYEKGVNNNNKTTTESSLTTPSSEKKSSTTTTLTFSASAAGLSPPLPRSRKEEQVTHLRPKVRPILTIKQQSNSSNFRMSLSVRSLLTTLWCVMCIRI